MSFTKVTITTDVAAPPARVWECYTAPKHITGWNFASDDWCCRSAENDLRIGGTYKARMEAKDGSFGFDFESIYEGLEPGRLIDLKMADGRSARTTFEPISTGTRVTTTFDAEDQNDVEMQRGGWQAILNNFKAYAEGA